MGDSISANILPFGQKATAFERRRNDRLLAAEICARPGGDHLEILDMSQRGMAIRAPHPFSIGGSYLFELLDEGRSLMIEGRICWCERTPIPVGLQEIGSELSFRTGIAFVGIQNRSPAAAREALARLPTAASEPIEDDEQLTADRISRLQRSDSPDESAELLLELLSADFEHLVLFRIRDEEIHAWLGRGPTLIPDRLKKLRLRLDRASIFLYLRHGGSFFYGRLPPMFAHLQLLRCWQGSLQQECALFPIRLKNRLVAVLYADVGTESLATEHLGSLKASTELFTRSLLDQILRRKSSGPAAPD